MVWLVLWACSGTPEPLPPLREEPLELPEPEPEPEPEPRVVISPLTEAVKAEMTGVTWREGCPVGLDELSRLLVPYLGPDGEVHEGELIVATSVAPLVARAFEAALDEGFEITSIRPAREFGGSDDAMMAVDNTSAFNCRAVTGGGGFSEHSNGWAIDVNPLRNPYVRAGRVLPPEGVDWVDRTQRKPGMLTEDSALVRTLTESGWGWGGTWQALKDYQHLSATGR